MKTIAIAMAALAVLARGAEPEDSLIHLRARMTETQTLHNIAADAELCADTAAKLKEWADQKPPPRHKWEVHGFAMHLEALSAYFVRMGKLATIERKNGCADLEEKCLKSANKEVTPCIREAGDILNLVKP